MLLYDSRVSGNCYKVRLLFSHLGLFDRVELSGSRLLDFLSVRSAFDRVERRCGTKYFFFHLHLQ